MKPAANPIEALFGSKADPTATQAAAQQRARRTSNPPPVQPTPQETKRMIYIAGIFYFIF